jgi:hypothetical protein
MTPPPPAAFARVALTAGCLHRLAALLQETSEYSHAYCGNYPVNPLTTHLATQRDALFDQVLDGKQQIKTLKTDMWVDLPAAAAHPGPNCRHAHIQQPARGLRGWGAVARTCSVEAVP